MMDNQPTHGELLEAINALRADIHPIMEMKADIGEVVEIMRAFKLGGKGIKWLASIVTALLTIGGMLLAIRAMAQSFWSGQ